LYDFIFLSKYTANDTKTMCHNEDIRDATDDICEIISEWYNRLLYDYNLASYDQCETIKELLEGVTTDPVVRQGIIRASEFLGGITLNELTAIGGYKLRRNAIVHKAKRLTQDAAIKRLDIACVLMSSECKAAVEKCIKVISK
jgi:hypothetical protein